MKLCYIFLLLIQMNVVFAIDSDSLKKESLIVHLNYGGDFKLYTNVRLDLERDMIRYHFKERTTLDIYHQFSFFQSKNFNQSVNYGIYPSFGLNFTHQSGIYTNFQCGIGPYSSFLYSTTFTQDKHEIKYHKVRAGYGIYSSVQLAVGYDFARVTNHKVPLGLALTLNFQSLNQQSYRKIPVIPNQVYGVQLTYYPKEFHRKKINEHGI